MNYCELTKNGANCFGFFMNFRYPLFFLVVFSLSALPFYARASGAVTQERVALVATSSAIKIFKDSHQRTPKSWEELTSDEAVGEMLDRTFRDMRAAIGYALPDRYAFVEATSVSLPPRGDGPYHGKLILCRTVPLLRNISPELGPELQRYVVYLATDGAVKFTAVEEKELTALFKAKQRFIPKRDELPIVESDSVDHSPVEQVYWNSLRKSDRPDNGTVSKETSTQTSLVPPNVVESGNEGFSAAILGTVFLLSIVLFITYFRKRGAN